MAGQEPESIRDLSTLSSDLLAEQEVGPRARVIAKFVAGVLPESAVCVYTLTSDGVNDFWAPRAVTGEAAVNEQGVPADSGVLGEVLRQSRPVLRQNGELKREDYSHIDTRKTLRSLACIPLNKNGKLMGALEILAFGPPNTPEDLKALLPVAKLAAVGLASAQAYEEERH